MNLDLIQPTELPHAYWGPAYTNEQVASALASAGLPCNRLSEEELTIQVARYLQSDYIVGWFQGRAEVGPRALGARSILGNPCYRANLLRVNHLKGREVWRPLAPSVPEEDFARFFDSSMPSRFMIVAAQVRPEVQRLIPAVVHVDGSTRPQIVERAINPRFWKMIKRFGELRGIPVVINTSFNLKGEPIVNTPSEAIDAFLRSDMDALAIEDFLILRSTMGK